MEITKKVEELIKDVIVENGYRLDEVLYVKEDKMNFLRVVIEKDELLSGEASATSGTVAGD